MNAMTKEPNQTVMEATARVLTTDTLLQIRESQEITLQGWKILDRWALGSPKKLITLESEGFLVLFNRLFKQQNEELKILTEQRPTHSHLADHEILMIFGIELML